MKEIKSLQECFFLWLGREWNIHTKGKRGNNQTCGGSCLYGR